MSGPTKHEWKARNPWSLGEDGSSPSEVCRLCGAEAFLLYPVRYILVGAEDIPAVACPKTCEETTVLLVHES